jgi:hypothetical protein
MSIGLCSPGIERIHKGHGRGSQNTLYRRIQSGGGSSGCPKPPKTQYVRRSGYGPGRNLSTSDGTPCWIESSSSPGRAKSAESLK